MSEKTTIQLEKSTVKLLKDAKQHPKESYNELIERMTKIYFRLQEENRYDEFLHKIQQPKMQELWDNAEDDAWQEL